MVAPAAPVPTQRTSRLPVLVVVVWIVALFTAWAAWEQAHMSGPFAAPMAETSSTGFAARHAPRAPRVDLYGNEIEEAFAEYQIHGDGDIYERHSPASTMPRPGRPEM